MPENLHKLFVISSPSGGGKTSLINKLFEDSRSANFEKSISDTILELDWQGAYAVKELFDDAKLIFLVPPSLDDLKQRLIKRNLDSSQEIENRLSEAKKEISKSEMYDYLVLNDDFDKAFEDLSQILFEGISPIDFNSRASKDLIKRLVE